MFKSVYLTKAKFMSTGIAAVLGFLGSLPAQMSGPTASAYFDIKDKFYIACYNGKNIVELSRDGTQKVFVSGLTAPNNIYYGDFPLVQGFAVLDSNAVKFYDTAGAYAGTETIAGAKKLTDATIDTLTGGIISIYTCDVLRGVIYKTIFPAPFYLPSTSIWVSGLTRPASVMVQPAKGRLLYTEDSANARIMAIDLSSKSVSVFYNTGTSNVVGLAEDGQGNLYFSSQGSGYIYQVNKYLSSSPKKVISEPKPGDLTILPPSDDICYTCIKCGTVFISKIHNFGPGNELMVCQGDSVFSYENILFKNFGTFDNGNEFLLKYTSLLAPNLNSGTVIGRVKDTLIPAEIKGKISSALKPGTYKVYWESTKPKIARTWNTLQVFAPPVASLFEKDSAAGCGNTNIELGKLNNPDTSKVSYTWFSNKQKLNKKNYKDTFSFTPNRWIKIIANDKVTGCNNIDSVYLITQAVPTLSNWPDTQTACYLDTLKLGPPANNLYRYHWSGTGLGADSLQANPRVEAVNNQNYKLNVFIEGCGSNYQLFVKVNPKPYASLKFKDSLGYCRFDAPQGQNELLSLSANNTLFSYRENNLSARLTLNSPGTFKNLAAGIHPYTLKNDYGCKDSGNFKVIEYPNDLFITQKNDTLSINNYLSYYGVKWFKNDTATGVLSTLSLIKATDTANYIVCGKRKQGDCEFCDSLYFQPQPKINTAKYTKNNLLKLFPNPLKQGQVLHISGATGNNPFSVFNAQGQLILKNAGNDLSTQNLPPGLYLLRLSPSENLRFLVN